MKEVAKEMAVVDIGCRGGDRLNHAAHADMGLHAEVPLIALWGLMHLWTPFPGLILRVSGRFNDRGIID